MKARITLLVLLTLAACGDSITEPGAASASIQVTNDSGFDQRLEVHLGPCGQRLTPVAELEPGGETQAIIVEPGCWRIAVYGTTPHGATATLCGVRFDVRAGETVRLRF